MKSSDTSGDTLCASEQIARMQDVGKTIRAARERLGLTQEGLGKLVGVSRSSVNQWESGATTPDATRLPVLARVLELQGDDVLGLAKVHKRTEEYGSQDMQSRSAGALDALVSVPHGGDMARDLPIRGTVSGGPGGFQMANGDAIDWVRRPPRLLGRKDVFGLYVEDTSMVPRFDPGALVVVEKSRPPAVGDDVVVELLPEHPRDERRALIKRLAGPIGPTVKLEQFNPPLILEFPRKRVANILRVMTLSDLLGT